MTTVTTPSPLALVPSLETAWQDPDSSFERFCLTAGIGAIEQMLWAMTRSSSLARRIIVAEAASATAGAEPRERSVSMVTRLPCSARGRSYDGHEVALPTWTAAQAEDWLGRWAMNLMMLINVSTRKLRRADNPDGTLLDKCRTR